MRAQSIDEKAIFKVACCIESTEARNDYLNQVCGGDHQEVRDRVAFLLRMQEESPSFMESPIAGGDATLDMGPVLEQPGTQIGPYKLLEQIGEGGMGIVYVASQKEPLRRKVALKIIKPGMDTREVVARFEAERQALALMDHPNIAKVFDAGATDAGRPYFAMELVKGTPITEYCDREQLTTRQRLALFVTLCHGVQHAHQKGVIHRDLKPSNLLIEVDDVRPVPKIIDFGIAKAVGQQLTEKTFYTAQTQMVGTPLYMSPEQAGQSCRDVDTRSDIYSLGVLLYELLTGHTPFEKDTLRTAGFDELRRIIRDVEPPRPSARVSTLQAADLSTISERRHVEPRKLSQELRGELDWIVMKAMDKDRDRRYATVNDLAADVERYLHDEPILAKPPTRTNRIAKWARRHRPVVWSAAVSAVVVMSVLVVSTILLFQGYQREKQQRNTAVANAEKAKENAAEAQQNYEMARQAVKQMLTRVADEQLASIPEMKDIRRRLLEDAVAFYTELLKLSPRDAQAYFERGTTHKSLAQYDRAQADYRKAIDLQPDNAEFQYALGESLICTIESAAKDPHRGLVHAKRAVELKPENCEYRFLLALAYFNLGMRDAARAELNNLEELDLNEATKYNRLAELYSRFGDIPSAFASNQKAIALEPSNAWLHYQSGCLLVSMGEEEQALTAFTKAIEMDAVGPSVRGALYYDLRGKLYASQKMYAAALADWDKALQIAPFNAITYKRRAIVHFSINNFSQALADITKAVELNPQDASNLWCIAPHLVAKCSDERLRNGLLKLADITIDKTKGSADSYAARATLNGAFGRPENALADFDKAVSLAPKNDFLWSSRASYYIQQANWESAIPDLSKAIELTPTMADTWYRRAMLRLAVGRPDEYRQDCCAMLRQFSQTDKGEEAYWVAWACVLAPDAVIDWMTLIALAEKTVQSDPKSAMYLNTLGAVLYRAGRFDEALARLSEVEPLVQAPSEAIKSPPAYTWYFLAMTQQRLGHAEEAKQWLDKAVAWTDKTLAEADQGTADLSWNRRLTLKLLRDEASALLGITPPTVEPAPEPAAKVEEAQELPKSTPAPEAARVEEESQ